MAKRITMTVDNTLTIGEGMELFIKKCKVKNLTDNSIRSYIQKNKQFINFIGGASVNIESISPDDIDNYILYMRDKGDAGATINSYIRAMRSLLYFLMDGGHLRRFAIKTIKTEKTIKETYTQAELDALLKKPDLKKVSFNEYKIWVLENYLLGTGNRISSVLELKIKDIDFNSYEIILRKTKSRKQEIIPLPVSLAPILQEYIAIRGGEPEDYLFCNSFGEKANLRTIQQMVANYNNTRGVAKTSCHLFRHTFAKMFIMNGGNAFTLQKLMGHSDLTITKEYVAMFGADLGKNYDMFNPLDNMLARRGNKIKM